MESKINKSILFRPEADGQGDHPLRMFVRLLDADKDKDGFIREDEWPRIHSWIDPRNTGRPRWFRFEIEKNLFPRFKTIL